MKNPSWFFVLVLNSFASATHAHNDPVLPVSETSTLMKQVDSLVHSITSDLRVAFSAVFQFHLTRRETCLRRSQLRRRVSQKILSSEICGIAVQGKNVTLDGNNGTKGRGTSPPSYNPSASPTWSSGAPAPYATVTSAASKWYLTESHQGTSFFDGWDFFVGSDPTNGTVTYVPVNIAFEAGLASVTDTTIFMRVETSPTVSNTRQSVRITTKNQYSNGGLFLLDVVHMPTGCAVWPAWWTNGPAWPYTGEIDILEAVGDYTQNQATLHTTSGCRLSSGDPKVLNMTGSILSTDCSTDATGNESCGIRAAEGNTVGAALNANGGGVYAMVWSAEGISVYFFPRASIPDDIEENAPAPERWPQPQAHWPASGCDPFKYFQKHSAIFDTTLCGLWASGVWGSAGVAGQEESCAARTGFGSCEEFVRQRGDAFKEAYWEINWMRIYKQRS